jgi:hypothetical protein
MVNEKHQPATHNPILRFTHYAFNPQPDFGANAPPTCQFHALRITLYAFNPQLTTRNPQPISGLTPLLPINFTHYASRITLYASRFTHHESRPFSKIANFAVKSVKSRITNHAPDGYQMTTEVVII